MEKDERLLPLPKTHDLQISGSDAPVNYSPVYDEESFDERRSLREYFNVVYKRLPLILALAIVTTAVAAFYMYRQASVFQAHAEMIIEPRKPKVQTKDAININFGNDINYYNTQLQLLQNPDLMREVVIRLGLYKDPNLFSNEDKGIGLLFGSLFSSEKNNSGKESSLPLLTVNPDSQVNTDQIVLSPDEKALVDKYAGVLLGGLTVEQKEKTNLVEILLKSTKSDLAAKASNMIITVFIEQDIKRETEGAKKSLEDLSKSIEDLKTTIADQEQERITYMQNSGLPLFEGKGQNLNASKLQTLWQNLAQVKQETGKLRSDYEAAKNASARGEILSVVGENKAIQEARSQNLKRIADLEKRIEDLDEKINAARENREKLLAKYTEQYREVVQTDAQIRELEAQKVRLRNEVEQKIKSENTKLEKTAEKEILAGLASQLQASQNREAKLQGDYDREINLANEQGLADSRLITLAREIDTNRNLLDSYIQSQKQQELALTSSKPDNLKRSTDAVTPSAPIGPKRERNIFIAFLVSLAAGIGLAFLLDYLDDSVKTSDDIGRHLGLPTLALIPHQTGTTKSKLGLITTKANGNGNSTAMVALEDTRSAMAEAYRHLRTSLLFSSAGKPPQTILVTSSQPAEGKTTTAINTAITLAQSGADVVIIDCDLRRPRLHNHFNFGNATGLTNYLSGEQNPENLLKPFPSLPKLKVITSGPIPPNPAELLSSNEMKNLLQFLKSRYKHVIIDSPPAISFTDAAILSTQVDGVVLVAMAGKSSVHLMRRFKQRLSNIGARIYGVVLNGIKSSSVEYGYYGYGYAYNYYANDEDDSTPLMEEVEPAASSPIHTTKG
jgi:capsular exopolysaccharide synthesis family protein